MISSMMSIITMIIPYVPCLWVENSPTGHDRKLTEMTLHNEIKAHLAFVAVT